MKTAICCCSPPHAHSGDEVAFFNLLSLLNPAFAELQHRTSKGDPLREQLARQFVQRRRKDIVEWQAQTQDDAKDGHGFPRMKAELTYRLSGAWGSFFDEVQAYCRELAETVERSGNEGGARLIWYATLALLRCVASSPAAAAKALNTRLEGHLESEEDGTDDDAGIQRPARRYRRRPE